MGKLFKAVFSGLNDEAYLRLLWRKKFHRELPINNPVTFNEKIQWMKLHYRIPVMPKIVDKATAKEYAASIIGEEYIIPTLGVWDKWEDIDFNDLPDQFVLKVTNGGGGRGVVVCKDKSKLDLANARKKLEKEMNRNIYREFREWGYKNVKPRFIAEVLMSDDTPANAGGLTDYKFSCFGGKVHDVMLCLDRSTEVKYYFFDRDWNLLRLNTRGKAAPEGFTLPKPEGMDQMFEIAEKLCQGFPYVRTDLYYVGGKIYFGELTFFPCSGFDKDLLPETDLLFGSLLKLPDPVDE